MSFTLFSHVVPLKNTSFFIKGIISQDVLVTDLYLIFIKDFLTRKESVKAISLTFFLFLNSKLTSNKVC